MRIRTLARRAGWRPRPTYLAAPYSTVVTTNLNSLDLNVNSSVCAPTAASGTVDVLWDPTFTTCAHR
jgi:hypothetical protein